MIETGDTQYITMSNKNLDVRESIILNILEELRITDEALNVMANGDSPNIIGVIDSPIGKQCIYRAPVVQLSQKLSRKLADLNLHWRKYNDTNDIVK